METQSVEDNTGDVDVGGVSDDGEVIVDFEMSVVYFSEKVSNLSIFMMNLETLEGELEGLVCDEENIDIYCVLKGFEFDLLCGVLGSEVRDLGLFLDTLHAEISGSRERDSSLNNWQERLVESEEQFYEIKKQSFSFERTLSSYKKEENGK